MISKIFLTGLSAVLLSGGIISFADRDERATVQTEITKAVLHQGEIIPMIELPTVEITGRRNADDLVHAIVVDGRVYPSYELEAVVIVPGA